MADSIPCLKSCEDLIPMAEDLKIVQKCVDVATSKVLNSKFLSRSPTNWWTEELSILDIEFFGRVISAMKLRCGKSLTVF
ncbi:hypothetical protein EV2_012304 [Malus domestica]